MFISMLFLSWHVSCETFILRWSIPVMHRFIAGGIEFEASSGWNVNKSAIRLQLRSIPDELFTSEQAIAYLVAAAGAYSEHGATRILYYVLYYMSRCMPQPGNIIQSSCTFLVRS